MIDKKFIEIVEYVIKRCEEDEKFNAVITLTYKDKNGGVRHVMHSNNGTFDLLAMLKEMADIGVKQVLKKGVLASSKNKTFGDGG